MGKNDVPRRGLRARRSPAAGDRARGDRHGARRRARARSATSSASADLHVLHAPSGEFPISPKEHGTAFLLEHRHLWLRSSRQHAVLRVRAEVIRACREYLDSTASSASTRPSSRPPPARARPRCSRSSTSATRPTSRRAASSTARPGRWRSARSTSSGPPSAPRSRRRAATSPSSGWSSPRWRSPDLDEDMDLAEDFLVHVVGRVLQRRRRAGASLERDVDAARARPEAVPAHHLRRGDRPAARRRASTIAWGDDLGAEAETTLSQQFDRPVMVHRYPLAAKAFYMKADPADPRLRAVRGRARARGLRRDHRRRPARGRPRDARGARSPSTTCRARPSTGTSTCAASAPCRTPASAWASSAASRGSAACTTCARRFRSPACSNACARDLTVCGTAHIEMRSHVASRPCSSLGSLVLAAGVPPSRSSRRPTPAQRRGTTSSARCSTSWRRRRSGPASSSGT